MKGAIQAIQSMCHFDPICELALARFEIDEQGRIDFLDEHGSEAVNFVIDLMEIYASEQDFQAERFLRYPMPVILEYLERTHALYELKLLPKMQQAMVGINKLFPDHVIAAVLSQFFEAYRRDLLEHIDLEESKLFPYARRLSQGSKPRDYGVNDFVEVHTHHIEDSLDKVINSIALEFPEVVRSFAYRNFQNLLHQFRRDLEIHHLIEEQVFLLMVEAMEREVGRLPYQ